MNMKMYPLPKGKSWDLFFGAFFMCMLCFARDTMISMSKIGITRSIVISFGLFFFAVIVFLLLNRKQLKSLFLDCRVAVAIVTAVVLLAPMVIKLDWQLMYISIFICACFGIFL